MKDWKSSLTIAAKPVEVGGCVSAGDGQRFIVRPGPLGAPGPPNGDGNNDGGGNTLDTRETSSMTDLRNTHSKDMTDSNTRKDVRIRNRDSRSSPVQSRFPQFREFR